jgi:lambda family phage portal protein
MGFWQSLLGWFRRRGPERIPVSALGSPAVNYGWHDGEKFAGGFGLTQILEPDYWTLRARSSQLFKQNLFARGVIRRLITNEINTGLHLEATPEERILGKVEDELADWTEDVENRFELWGESPGQCDRTGLRTLGQLQAVARLEALVAGDVLVMLEQNPDTRVPMVRLICGSSVQTPLGATAARGNRIVHGVELDGSGRHVAYWIRQEDGTARRLPATGATGRKIAWLVYGTEKRLEEVRGEPLLSIVLQSLREIDRYRDSTQRKAVVNSILAMFVEKTEDKPGSRPLTRGGISRAVPKVQSDTNGTPRRFTTTEMVPGLTIEELQTGETIKAHGAQGTDEKYADFQDAIIYGVAWSLEIPPEILTLSFNANYSASQAAINEFKMYLDRVRTDFGRCFCAPIYNDWLLSEVLNERIAAPGMLDAWRDPRQHDIYAAWTASDWTGHIKPSTDILKQARGYRVALDRGLTNYDRASREFSGTKFSKNVRKLRRELEMLREIGLVPIETEGRAEPGEGDPDDGEGRDEDEASATVLYLPTRDHDERVS